MRLLNIQNKRNSKTTINSSRRAKERIARQLKWLNRDWSICLAWLVNSINNSNVIMRNTWIYVFSNPFSDILWNNKIYFYIVHTSIFLHFHTPNYHLHNEFY